MRRFLLIAILSSAASALTAQEPCVAHYNSKSIAAWRSAHPAGYAVQEPMLNVDNPFPSEVILHFYNPATQQLFESYRVPAGGKLRGLRYKGKPFFPGSDWGVRLSKGGETSCIQFLGGLVEIQGAALLLKLDGLTKNGFPLGATPGVPRKAAPQPEAEPETDTTETPDPVPQQQSPKDRVYSIYVHNRNAFPIEVAYAQNGEQTKAWVKVPAGSRQLLFQSRVGSFCLRAEYTDASGARRGWGGDVEKTVNGEKKKFRCRVLGPTEWTYTAAFGGG
ncbi:MAG: hypothetical protein EOO15_16020 [Chitinophagaceae bacterium]|nr:MAG: hypothetical protein EOO15_16020 [Chitinophagaceae bacterium]